MLKSLSWIDACIGETNELSDDLGKKASTVLQLSLQLSSRIDCVKPPQGSSISEGITTKSIL